MKFVLGFFLILSNYSCLNFAAYGTPGFADPNDVVKRLAAKQLRYMDIAEGWAQSGHTKFCRFSESSWRWGDYFIDQEGYSYSVRYEGKRIVSNVSLSKAAQAARVSVGDLTKWQSVTDELAVYCLSIEPPGQNKESQFVQILFAGSEYQPYGLRYAPEHSRQAYEDLFFMASKNGSIMDNTMKHITERWFYFESRR